MREPTIREVFNTFTSTQKNKLYYLIGKVMTDKMLVVCTADDFIPALTPTQLTVAHLLMSTALEDSNE